MKLKKITYMAMMLGGTLVLSAGCAKVNPSVDTEVKDTEESNIKTISAVGDIMVHGAQIESQLDAQTNTYDFSNNFKYIKDIISNSDLSIANLETTVNVFKNPSGYPSFNSPKELLRALKGSGFDIISTINNHTLDTGYNGVLSTINELKVNGLKYVGTKESVNDKNYLIQDIDGTKIGITAFSYGGITSNNKYLNGIPSGEATNLLNVMDESSVDNSLEVIKKEVDLMKSEGAEFIIVELHWGKEYEKEPNEFQKQLAQKLANEGVDIILGSHPHVVQPVDILTSEADPSNKTIVFYSMGNIISNQREEEMGFQESENGVIPMIGIEEKEDGKVEVKSIEYIPTWVNKYKDTKTNKYIYEILPIDGELSELSKKYNVEISNLEKAYNNVKSMMDKDGVSLYKKSV